MSSCNMEDLIHYEYVFLQHGVTKDDISDWLHQYDRYFSLFITAGVPEYYSLLEPQYGLSTDIVKLTGFPRHDYRSSETLLKQVLIVPTYRQSVYKQLRKLSRSDAFIEFKNSDFFLFWSALISDLQFQRVLKERGYRAVFCLHPNFCEYIAAFHGNAIISINHGFPDYPTLFARSSLLITDYSSVSFEMSYLRKPVVYVQFDRERFFRTHAYKQGYFEYETSGFGPVCRTVPCVCQTVRSILEKNCTIDSKYMSRITNFFPFFDRNNSLRVYHEILQVSRKELPTQSIAFTLLFLSPFLMVILVTYRYFRYLIDNNRALKKHTQSQHKDI